LAGHSVASSVARKVDTMDAWKVVDLVVKKDA